MRICIVHQNTTDVNFLQIPIDEYLLHVCEQHANELLCIEIQIAVYKTSSATHAHPLSDLDYKVIFCRCDSLSN